MSFVCSFPPLARADARLLILGSMPGVASLRAGRYYAHPHNQFWPIVGSLYGFAPDAPYAERCAALLAAGVAVWDVLQSCERPGSLDTAIQPGSETVNDFEGFLAAHPAIRRICFNGAAAEKLFLRKVRGQQHLPTGIECLRLPSTSPAHAGLRPADKLARWREGLFG